MVLVDTSVWVNHLRQGDPVLANLLTSGLVLMHPFVRGELACGTFKDRRQTLFYLSTLAPAKTASTDEVLGLLERRMLWGKGLSWIDAHLVASALLSHARLWTADKQLHAVASQLKLA